MHILSLKDQRLAHTFVDYMATKGVELRVELDQAGNSHLFLLDEDNPDKLALVKHEVTLFIANPYDKRYSDALWQSNLKKGTKKKVSSFPANYRLLPGLIIGGPVTLSITACCIGVYVLLLFLGSRAILAYLGFPISADFNSQVWRFITPIFIHFSLLHILFNLTWWWYLGGMVEKQRGKFKLIEITFIAGLLSNYAQFIMSGPYFGGLSGIAYALMGYVWLYGERVRSSGLRLERIVVGIAVVWLCAGYVGILETMANTAHLVGLIVGLLLAAKDIWLIKK